MNQYSLVRRLKSGGQGEIWVCRRDSDGLEFALKYLQVDTAESDHSRELGRFKRELNCQATLSHANIVPIVGYNLEAEKPFYIMPLAKESLKEKVVRDGAHSDDQTLEIFNPILDAIAYAHSNGVVHRDLKPENILFIDEKPMLSDFGVSRRLRSESLTLTVAGAMLGTVQYAAPEQFKNAHEADVRADIYSLGKILLELLTGDTPFPVANISAAPQQFRYVIAHCLETDPDDRYQTVADLKRELSLLDDFSELVDPPLARAQEAVSRFMAGEITAVQELDRILITNSHDELLYLRLVPYLPRELVERYAQSHAAGFETVLREFDKYVSGQLSFDYTDTVADFLLTVFGVTQNYEIRKIVLRRVLEMGYSHNRWHVGSVFATLIEQCRDTTSILIAAQLLRSHSEAAKFVGNWLRSRSLPSVIADALP